MTPTAMAAPTIHEQLREWRGSMKLDRAAVYVSDLIGREVSRETIRRYEVEADSPRTLDPVLLAGLARVYGHDPAELPNDVLTALDKVAKVIAQGPHAGVTTISRNLRRRPVFAPESVAA